MFNKIILTGNLTRDIDLRYMKNSTAVATTGIATSRKFKKQDGTQAEEICFVDISFFGRSAEIANQYLHKGSKVLIDGRLKLDSWTDNNSQKRSKHSVIVETMQMLDSKSSNQTSYQDYKNDIKPSIPIQEDTQVKHKVLQQAQLPIVEDDIPF